MYYIGGLLKHAPALCGFIAPTTNSYRRLVPGYEAPINLVYSQRNRSAAVRIPMYSKNEKIKAVPGSLEESLNALEKDHDFLLKGGVFTPDVIETWLTYKRKKELDAIRLRPHPYEFALYFDI